MRRRFMNEVVIYIASIIGGLSFLIILLMVTIRSLIDVGIAIDLLPKWLIRRAREVRREELLKIIEELGLNAKVDRYKAILQNENFPKTAFSGRYKDVLKDLIKSALIERDTIVGHDIDTRLRYFINLREHCLNYAFAEKCAKIMCEYLKEMLADNHKAVGAIVAHRNGSILIAYEVSRILNLPFLIVSEKTHIKTAEGRKEFLLEGHNIIKEEKSPPTAILIDDSTTDGYMALECANVLCKHNINMHQAFVLFYRKEGKARKALDSAGIQLNSILEFDDDLLALNSKSMK